MGDRRGGRKVRQRAGERRGDLVAQVLLPVSESDAFHPSNLVLHGNNFTVTKINRSYRNGRRRRDMAIIYAHAQRRVRPKSRGP